ncbi:pilus assembly protein PilX [Variovorax sp. RO1]|uniref:pilus assembly protein PilX n=1 Tax=Variovorax sp. RO1 TaxID=2066034 RepID=UPI000C7179C7|nr:pilus assembly protein PilX [Variovorax sp. RO1]
MNSFPTSLRTRAPLHQRGASLLFALLTLVAMLLATLALVRSVDTSTTLLGNIGFKQDATVATDQAARTAIDWLSTNAASLNTSLAANGYYANTKEFADDGTTTAGQVDVTGGQLAAASRRLVDWDNDTCRSAASGTYADCTIKTASAGTINGNSARYVIFRLCNKPGDYGTDNTIHCAKPMNAAGTSATKRGELNYSDYARFANAAGPYYRVVVRVTGARNTASFAETIVHF